MGILSKLAGKAIKEGIEGGLKGPKTKALFTRADLPPEAPAAPVARETPAMQPTPTPAEITPPTTDMAPITSAPPVAADKQARMMMLQDKPIETAPPITPIETPPIRAEIDEVLPVRTEMDELVPSAGGRGGGKGGGEDGDGIDFAGQRFSKAPDVDESKDALELADIETVQKGDFKTPRKEDLQKAARQLEEGTITGKQYRQIAKEQSPIEPFTEVPEPATLEKIAAVLKGEGALGIKKLLNGLIGFNRNIEQGVKVLSRLDIPAYNNFNTWIATVTHKGKSMYGPTAVLKNVEFKPHTTPSLKIAKGEGSKQPFATMSGNWQNMSSKDIRKFVEDNDILEKSLDDANEEWVQVGFNPERHGFFYHKSGKHKGRPIFEADEMIQIGALVLARKPKKPSLTQLKKLKVKGVNAIFNKGGVVDMRDGGSVRMAKGGQAAAYDLSELEKAVDIDREGLTESSRFVQDYGKHRVGRMSQTDTGYPPLPQQKDVIGKFYGETKDIYTKPYDLDKFGRPVPFDKKAAGQIEDHELNHKFANAARAISMNEKVLKTLPVKDQKRLFKFLDFWEKQVTPEGSKFGYFTREHDIMGTSPYADIKQKSLHPPGRMLKAAQAQLSGLSQAEVDKIQQPKRIWTADKPLAVLPDDPVGKGIGRSSTINKIAKSLNKAYAKYPEVYNEFFKKWRKEGTNLPTYAGTYSKKLAALTSKGNQSGFSKEVEKLQGSYKNKGGKIGAAVVAASLMASGGQASAYPVVDMRDGGRVKMADGGSTSYQATPEFINYLKLVENAGNKGLKGEKWYPIPSTGANKKTHNEIGYGIEIPKGTYATGLTQEEVDNLFNERIKEAAEGARRVVDNQKGLGKGTFDLLPNKKKAAFVDYVYNLGEGKFSAYKNFIPALVNDDREAVQKEYKRHTKVDGKWVELGRNKHFMKYFSEFFPEKERILPEKERSRASYSFSYFPKQTIL